MPVEKVCLVCGTPFRVPPCRAESAKTCSMKCKGELWTIESQEDNPQKECKVCGKTFKVYPSHTGRRECCSIKCANKVRGKLTKSGSGNPAWKDGTTVHSDGYLYLSVKGHPFTSNGNYVFEHRLVMEQWMRESAPNHKFLVEINGTKYLNPDISVHHIDGNKRNNKPKNLLACTNSSHHLIHNGKPPMQGEVWPEVKGQAVYQPVHVKRICELCGAEFMKLRSDVARGFGRFCSRTCYDKRPRKCFEVIPVIQ